MRILIFIILIFIGFGKTWAFQTVSIYIEENDKKSYIEFLDINKTKSNPINFEIKTSKRHSSIKEISSENNLKIQPIEFNNKRKKKKFEVKKDPNSKFFPSIVLISKPLLSSKQDCATIISNSA